MMSSSLEVKIHNILTDYDIPFAELDDTNPTELMEIAEKIWDKE